MPAKKILLLISACLLLLFSGSCSFLDVNEPAYSHLEQEYNSLAEEHNNLINQYNALVAQNNALLTRESAHIAEKEQLIDEMQTYYEQMNGAITPPYITMNGRKATFTFRDLNGNIESWTFDVEILEANTVTGTLMRELEIADLNELGLGDIAQRFKKKSKYINLDDDFRRIDCRPYIVKENFLNWAPAFYFKHTDDESRIMEVWNMVTQLCPYTGELEETPRLPLETLLFGGGDCEDLAILTASILKGMSPGWDVKLVYMDADNPSDYVNINHISVFVDTGDFNTFVESTQGAIMNPYESVKGFYVAAS